MAFEATVIVVQSESYSCKTIMDQVIYALNPALAIVGLTVGDTLSIREYLENTKSTRIPRYIRVVEKRSTEENTKKIQIDSDPYEDGIFVTPTHTLVCSCETQSVSGERLVVTWINFSKLLASHVPAIEDVPFTVANILSSRIGKPVHVLHATSRSRSEDRYAIYVNGKNANPLHGKGALTNVKNIYGIDINTVMDAIDQCLAIVFAPYDIVDAKAQLEKHKERILEFEKNAENLVIKDKQDGSNMVDKFRKENELILSSLQTRYDTLARALHMDPNGTVIAFKLARYHTAQADPRESFFGIRR